MSSFFQDQIKADVRDIFLNLEEWAETVTYTRLDKSTKDIPAEVHLNVGGGHNELGCVIDIGLDPAYSIPDPRRGELLKRQLWPFETWRIVEVSEAQHGMIALVCERIDQE